MPKALNKKQAELLAGVDDGDIVLVIVRKKPEKKGEGMASRFGFAFDERDDKTAVMQALVWAISCLQASEKSKAKAGLN